MKNSFLTLLLVCLCACGTTIDSEPIHTELQAQLASYEDSNTPRFPGGHEAYVKYMSENVQYPKKAIEENTEGQVLVKFVVDKTGKSSKIEIEDSLSPECDAEAIRVIKSIKNWEPAVLDGKSVNTQVMHRIVFRLKDGTPSMTPMKNQLYN